MSSFTVTIEDRDVLTKLQELQTRVQDMTPVLRKVGDALKERVKQRFETSTAPDGSPWVENSPATLELFARGLGSSYFSKKGGKKTGVLNGKGFMAIVNKKPLIGDTKRLMREIHYEVSENALTLTAAMPYAAIQHYGGTTGARSWIPSKSIPARPFMPIQADGSLYPAEKTLVLDVLNEFLFNGF